MSNHSKAERAERLSKKIRSILPESPKGMYLFVDRLIAEMRSKYGDDSDLIRAMRVGILGDTPDSKDAVERLARRRHRCNRDEPIDLYRFDHLLSLILDAIAGIMTAWVDEWYRPVIIEHLPELLAAMTLEERDNINRKMVAILEGRDRRKKKSKNLATPVQEEAQFTNDPEASAVEQGSQVDPSMETVETENTTIVDYPESATVGPESMYMQNEEVEGVSDATTVAKYRQWDQEARIDPIPEEVQPASFEVSQSTDQNVEGLSQ